tara:strand:+ start:180 stop:458 length:279 start_codon:yes stop_codon:yes gene_type:complete
MKISQDGPFEIEIVADYLNRGESVVYFTRLDPEQVKRELLGFGIEEKRINRHLLLMEPKSLANGRCQAFSEFRPDKIIADSVSDVFNMKWRI